MFRATHRPSLEAQIVFAASGFTYDLVACRCEDSAIATTGNHKRM